MNGKEKYKKEFPKGIRVDYEYVPNYSEVKLIINVEELREYLNEIETKTFAIYLATSPKGTQYLYRWVKNEPRTNKNKKDENEQEKFDF